MGNSAMHWPCMCVCSCELASYDPVSRETVGQCGLLVGACMYPHKTARIFGDKLAIVL